jgi:3-hydroxyisobutyrate dehydrogenase-like beta-hydroxyacid dehydrogenase
LAVLGLDESDLGKPAKRSMLVEGTSASAFQAVGRARICKIAHNVFLGVIIPTPPEITILAQKAGVPRHAFLDFMNASVCRKDDLEQSLRPKPMPGDPP